MVIVVTLEDDEREMRREEGEEGLDETRHRFKLTYVWTRIVEADTVEEARQEGWGELEEDVADGTDQDLTVEQLS